MELSQTNGSDTASQQFAYIMFFPQRLQLTKRDFLGCLLPLEVDDCRTSLLPEYMRWLTLDSGAQWVDTHTEVMPCRTAPSAFLRAASNKAAFSFWNAAERVDVLVTLRSTGMPLSNTTRDS